MYSLWGAQDSTLRVPLQVVLLTNRKQKQVYTIKSENSESQKSSFKLPEFHMEDFPGGRWCWDGASAQDGSCHVSRWKCSLGEKQPQMPFYFLVPNQEGKQQPQINTQMIHEQDNTLSTLLTKPQMRQATQMQTDQLTNQVQVLRFPSPTGHRKQIQSKLAYAEGEASAEGKGAPHCTCWGDILYFQIVPLGSQRHSKQMGQVPQSWSCSHRGPQMQIALPQGRKAQLEKGFWAAHVGTTYSRNETNSRPKSEGPYCKRAVCRGRPVPARKSSPRSQGKMALAAAWDSAWGTPDGAGLLWAPSPGRLAKLVPVQSPCAQCLERPKLKIS